jgi:hypothetical protein
MTVLVTENKPILSTFSHPLELITLVSKQIHSIHLVRSIYSEQLLLMTVTQF